MNDDLPEGWVPIPHAVDPVLAPSLAEDLLAAASAGMPGLVDDAQARALAVSAMVRLPVDDRTFARLWHVLGPSATGLTVDLSTVPAPADWEARAGAGMPSVHVQRRIPLTDGLATIAFIAPDDVAPPAVLLRVQREEAGLVLTADVIDTDLGLIGLVLDDVIGLVGADRPG